MKVRKSLIKFVYVLLTVAIFLSIVFSLYFASLPTKYILKVNDISGYDINAIRSVKDLQATNQRANLAASEVKDVMLVNPKTTQDSIDSITKFFEVVRTVRIDFLTPVIPTPGTTPVPPKFKNINEAAVFLKTEIKKTFSKDFTNEECLKLLSLEAAEYEVYSGHAKNMASLILSSPVSNDMIAMQIGQNIASLTQTMSLYTANLPILSRILNTFVTSNIEFNKKATDASRNLAYQTVIDNPVMIAKGTRIINFGEVITAEKFQLLEEMDLIDKGEFDYTYLGGILLFVLMIILLISVYVREYEKANIRTIKDKASVLISMLIPFMLSLGFVKISNLAPPVYIAAVLITAYFGFRTGVLMSILLTFTIMPITGFDPKFMIVGIIGSVVASLVTLGISKRNNYALIIIATTMSCFVSSLTYNILTKNILQDIFKDAIIAVISGSVSVILAIGLMPLFEMIFNSLSPLRLIELSQPGHPLLRRLFVEAPGTSQHCVMVGNLAEAGAEAIGANSLIARVGAYYHDIGKLENPEMFTENQEGINPHDKLSPEESSSIIIAHPESGLRIAKKYRIPMPICKLIYEHHGTSKQMFFLRKAQNLAQEKGLPEPDVLNFTYKTDKPSSKESGILMLADTVEAAMKSTGITNLEDAHVLIKRLIRQKIEEEQLIDSELSFKDVENLIQAFLHVYSGHFRIRVRYPDDNTVSK
jgi:putative nucleotidyltransferase with HDIG domain